MPYFKIIWGSERLNCRFVFVWYSYLIKFKLHDIVMHLNKITTKGWLFDDYYRQTMALIKSVGKSLSTAVSVSDIKYESIL